jgi:hypothetical protein
MVDPCCCAVGGPCDARNAVNSEEEAPKQPTLVNLPPDVDGTVVVPRHCLWVVKVRTNWRSPWGWEREISVRFHFLHCLSTPNHRPLLPTTPTSWNSGPLASVFLTLFWERRSNAMIPNLTLSTQSEWRMTTKPGAREPRQCLRGEDPASR